ncbi:MAG: hypothetical protein R2844_16340 [Caldilineales bacterium]
MNRSRRFRLAMLLLAAMVLLLPTAASADKPSPDLGVQLTQVGDPIWMPVDFHLFSAPIGTAPNYDGFMETALGLLPEPNHTYNPALGVGPGAPHDPPYDQEMADGVAAQGYRETVRFRPSELRNGNAIWTAWMNVPYPGTTGSSPDFESGAIIPNEIFPIEVTAVSTRNGAPYSNVFEGSVPPLSPAIWYPPVDGHSHFPFFLADNSDFGPPHTQVNGSYRWDVTMRDSEGNGWDIEVTFLIGGWGNQ